ncbi:MAG: DUF4147 domain-containing protein [Thermoguttaceae bacterium]|nr:DUF4147 domain-containing protein [Thermoguttaceae bacterium]
METETARALLGDAPRRVKGPATHRDAREIMASALSRVLPESAVRRYVSFDPTTAVLTVAGRQYDLTRYDNLIVVGGGKAARRTATELAAIVGERITAGALNVYQDQAHGTIADNLRLYAADHPTPNEEGVEGAKEMIRLLEQADERTLVIALISGGGSALMALPVEGVGLDDYQAVCRLLLTVPATIDEINCVRKHIDPLKGGGMRKYAKNAGAFISLVLSDVPVTKTGIVDDPSVISSGPTVGDDSTFEMARKVLADHGLWNRTPPSIRQYIERNVGREDRETLSKSSALLAPDKSQYVIIADNDQAMAAAGEKAEQLGYAVRLCGWNTGTTADKIKEEVSDEIQHIWDTVSPSLADNDRVTFASFSTDGVDGHSELAGAIADANTLAAAQARGLDYEDHLRRYDSATLFERVRQDLRTGPTGTNVADLCLVLVTNPTHPRRKFAFVFGGEATVNIRLPDGASPGFGGRNTHLALLAAERLARRPIREGRLGSEEIKQGLIRAGIVESHIDIDPVALLGYSTDVGPIKMEPKAVVGVRSHEEVENAVAFAREHAIPITARGAGSGLPGQSVGEGIVLDMRSMDAMRVLEDHPEGGKCVWAQAGVICTNLNKYLKEHGVFLASYPSSTDMATIGGMIANNSSGANSCKLGTTQHQVLDARVVLADGTSTWTSAIQSGTQPWNRILELVRENKEVIEQRFPRVPKNSSGYNVLDILRQVEAGAPRDWSILFAHSEGTLGIVTEAKLRALPLATNKATCIVYFTSLNDAFDAIPAVFELGPSCFDTAMTTNLELIRRTFPAMNIPEDAKVMYLVEFDDLHVAPDPRDPARRIGTIRRMDKEEAEQLIASQVEQLRTLLARKYPDSAMGFEVATDPARQDMLWQGRRNALQVLYAYDKKKRPLTMIECVVLPRDGVKIMQFVHAMEKIFGEEGVVAGTHGHAGDCNFHIYLLLNLKDAEDRARLINVMSRIAREVAKVGGSMSGEHADGRTRGMILPHVFGFELFDLFVRIKDQVDPGAVLHPGTKIIKEARSMDLREAVATLVGVEEHQSRLNLARFGDFSHLYSGVCSCCSQCADACPVFSKLPGEFTARSEAAPVFKRVLAHELEGGDAASLRDDPLFEKVFDMCLLCGQCTSKCPTSASMIDMVGRIRSPKRNRIVPPIIEYIVSHRFLYNAVVRTAGLAQFLWRNPLGRAILAVLPQRLLRTHVPLRRYLPPLAWRTVQARYPKLYNLPASKADVGYFYGCSSDLLAEPIMESFIAIAGHNGWRVSLPAERCCGEPFAAAGNMDEYLRLARYNIDLFHDYKYVVAHCPTCLLAFKEYATTFARIGDPVYERKARDVAGKCFDPARLILEELGSANMKAGTRAVRRKVAVHVSCHERLGHKVSATANRTLDLLNRIPGVEVVDMPGADECCGLGGPWGLGKHYDLSVELRKDKIRNVERSGADVVTSWCPACLIQMRDGLKQAGSRIEVKHPFELVASTYE